MKNLLNTLGAFAVLSLFASCENKTEPIVKELAVAELETVVASKKTNTYLYVTASSGLSLRAYTNLNSEKLAVMPYGTKLKVVSLEEKQTMNVGGIPGGMHQVVYNNKTGYAFNGYLSELFPPERGANAKMYVEDLQKSHPTASFLETIGGTASNPINTQTILLPINKWHEAYLIAQKLYEIPGVFGFPKQKGKEKDVINNPTKITPSWVSELQVERKENTLLKIVYANSSDRFARTVTISQEGDMMKIEEVREVN